MKSIPIRKLRTTVMPMALPMDDGDDDDGEAMKNNETLMSRIFSVNMMV